MGCGVQCGGGVGCGVCGVQCGVQCGGGVGCGVWGVTVKHVLYAEL